MHVEVEFRGVGVLFVCGFHVVDFEHGMGEVGDVEEVRCAEMVVAFFDFGIDAGHVDFDFDDGVGEVNRVEVCFGECPLRESAVCGGDGVLADKGDFTRRRGLFFSFGGFGSKGEAYEADGEKGYGEQEHLFEHFGAILLRWVE